jgi:hypothetical protein
MKTDKEKLFEAFEKICNIKLFKEENKQELIEENWKNWAVALGIASASLFAGNAMGQSKLKDKIETIKDAGQNKLESVKELVNDKINKDPVLKQLEKDGYVPGVGERINTDKRLSDPNIETLAETETGARFQLLQILDLKGIKFNQINGIIVYKVESPTKVKAKYISYQ